MTIATSLFLWMCLVGCLASLAAVSVKLRGDLRWHESAMVATVPVALCVCALAIIAAILRVGGWV